MLESLATRRQGRSQRISSWDTTGRNRDCWTMEPKSTTTLANIPGSGVVRHIWFTISCEDENYLRKLVLRIYWDGMKSPSVETPVGDFFGVGHARVASFSSAVLNMSANPGQSQHAAMNCYLPMPFADGARFEIENECDVPVRSFYFYIDYDSLDRLPEDQLRFHAHWRRNNVCQPPAHQGKEPEVNLADKDNYLILEAQGAGHYVGCNLSVHNLYGGWWGEGDDMFMIDGEKWPPDMHGTGSEDYFSHAWGMQVQNAYIYNGVSYHAGQQFGYNERITVYRYHVCDPVIFHKSLRVSIEHGHANDRCDDYSSVAYWYQTLPHRKFPVFLKVADRLPRPDVIVQPVDLPIPVTGRHRSGSGIDPAFVVTKASGRKKR